ncbi:MAG: family 16 glycoside hydrolase [Candidatus Pacearchaeota archaeon]
MAKTSLITIFMITTLLILTLAVIGAGCSQQEQRQQQGQEQQEQQQDHQQPSILFSDDFNTEQSGAIPSKWTIVTKEGLLASVKGTTQSNDIFGMVLELKGRFIKTGGANWQDYTIETEFKIFNAGEHTGPEILFRLQDDNNYYLFSTETQPTGTNYILYKVADKQQFELKQRAQNKRIDDEKWHKIKLNIRGNDFSAEIDGENVMTTTFDGTFNSGGIGLMSHPFSDIYFDNIVVIGTTT